MRAARTHNFECEYFGATSFLRFVNDDDDVAVDRQLNALHSVFNEHILWRRMNWALAAIKGIIWARSRHRSHSKDAYIYACIRLCENTHTYAHIAFAKQELMTTERRWREEGENEYYALSFYCRIFFSGIQTHNKNRVQYEFLETRNEMKRSEM